MIHSMVISLFAALIVSLVLGGLIIRFQYVHAKFTIDHVTGPQKFHSHDAIRVGGIPILVGWFVGLCVVYFRYGFSDYFSFFISTLPVFAIGLVEDITRKVRPLTRLLAAFVSASIALYLLNVRLDHLDVPFIDHYLIAFPTLAIIFTIFCIGGVTHAFNIIDGYNGLSGMVSIIILLGLSYVSHKLGDNFLLAVCFSLIGAIGGFLFWNYPRGQLFAGDCGAYLMGYSIATISVVAVFRHSEISPWFPLLLVIYPTFETLFSMYRRRVLQGRSVSYPDSLHLHSVIYKRLVRWMVGSPDNDHQIRRNAMTSPYLWVMTITTIIPAVSFWYSTKAIVTFVIVYMGFYIWLYRRLVTFRTPRFLIIQKNHYPPTNKTT